MYSEISFQRPVKCPVFFQMSCKISCIFSGLCWDHCRVQSRPIHRPEVAADTRRRDSGDGGAWLRRRRVPTRHTRASTGPSPRATFAKTRRASPPTRSNKPLDIIEPFTSFHHRVEIRSISDRPCVIHPGGTCL